MGSINQARTQDASAFLNTVEALQDEVLLSHFLFPNPVDVLSLFLHNILNYKYNYDHAGPLFLTCLMQMSDRAC